GPWQIPKSDPVEGFCLFYSACPIIVVRKHDAVTRQVFTLFHELAHLILHRESFIDEQMDLVNQAAREREANSFAGHLLVPDTILERAPTARKPDNPADYDEWLHDLRTSLSVSSEVILRRMLDAARISNAEYQAYRAWKGNQPTSGGDG